MAEREQRLKQRARDLGFDLVGIARASEADGFDRLRAWLEQGFAGTMNYMHRHAQARQHPTSILPEVRSVVMVGLSYPQNQTNPGREASRRGKVARYARGDDYHDVIRARLKELLAWLQEERPGCRGRAVVDTAPLLERDFARRAGLGWFGKNTMLLNKRQGSYFFLGALLVDLDLEADAAHDTSHCGRCTACLDVCPTEAFPGPGWLDSRRCISYLTIEHRGSIPTELREGLQDWVFGCDLCQEVCPWNRKHAGRTAFSFESNPALETLDLIEVLGLSEEEFRARFAGTPLTRPGRSGLLRNAALVLGNVGDQRALPALRCAQEDPDPVIREAATWAIARIEQRL
jgi:epoxyqueuosine reductase